MGEWLHGCSAGSPLHAIEIVRQLTAGQVLRYTGGIWTILDDDEFPTRTLCDTEVPTRRHVICK